MVPGRSSKTANAPRRPGKAAAQTVCFAILAGGALAVLAAVVLLPAYARLSGARYELGCLKANLADAEALIAANQRLIEALPEDEILTKRLAMSQLGLWPVDEVIVIDPVAAGPPALIRPTRHARPAPPAGRLTSLAGRLERLPARRGLFGLAAGAILAAMFLFAPSEKRRKNSIR